MLNTTNMAFIQSLSQFISSGISIRRDPAPSPYILSTSPPDSTMELYVLEHKLQVCSFPKDIISQFCLAIIKIALLPDSRPNFFSLTETADEYTLIVTEDDFKELPKHEKLKTSGYPWRVLTVSVGAMGTSNEVVGVSKIAKSVIGPLADQNISVLCLSTYQSDYVLVQQPLLDVTIKCLGSYFKIFNENHKRVNVAQILSSSPSTPTTHKKRAILHPFKSPGEQYHITGLDASKLSGVIQVLLELIFFSGNKGSSLSEEENSTFFHFSVVSGDISLILDNNALEKFPNNVLYTRENEDIWRMIKIGDHPLGFEECGIVAQVVEPLASWQLSTYYVSTFNVEYCMVLEKDIERVLEILEERKKENMHEEELILPVNGIDLIGGDLTQQQEEKECRPGENMSLGDAIEISTEERLNLYNSYSTSPLSPTSDDSFYGTSPEQSEQSEQSDTNVQSSSYNGDNLLDTTLKPESATSEPIPIPNEIVLTR